jgi:hypothetical protein
MRGVEDKARSFLQNVTSRAPKWYANVPQPAEAEDQADGEQKVA